jgi:hypothetical protein
MEKHSYDERMKWRLCEMAYIEAEARRRLLFYCALRVAANTGICHTRWLVARKYREITVIRILHSLAEENFGTLSRPGSERNRTTINDDACTRLCRNGDVCVTC